MEAPPPRRFRRSTLLIIGGVVTFCAIAVAVAVVFAGGDDDDDSSSESDTIPIPTADAYSDQLGPPGTELARRLSELQTELQVELAAEDDEAARLVIVKENFAGNAAAYDEFVQALAAVSPPDDLGDAHEDMVAAGEAYVAALNDAISSLEDAATFDEAQAIILGETLEEARSAFVDTCGVLVQRSQEHGATVEVFC
jgi:hypothetical protein